MCAVPGVMAALPFCIMRSVPQMAMGTMGAPVDCAMWNGPRLNGSRRPVRERVPSKKMRCESPDWIASTSAVAVAFDRDELTHAHRRAEHRDAHQ